ncbi:thymidylate synthase [Francisella tularensis]|uniref:thymidylate synthase n=1 Tax=Francisella tularensis TaxID=263 RepID=UPI0038780E04
MACYSLLTLRVAHQCNLYVGELSRSGGDCHSYNNHIEKDNEILNCQQLALPTYKFFIKSNSIFYYKE